MLFWQKNRRKAKNKPFSKANETKLKATLKKENRVVKGARTLFSLLPLDFSVHNENIALLIEYEPKKGEVNLTLFVSVSYYNGKGNSVAHVSVLYSYKEAPL